LDHQGNLRFEQGPTLASQGWGTPALWDCQGFEYGLTLLLFHLSRIGTKGLDPVNIAKIMDNKAKKTTGQLIAMLKKHATVSAGI
jgi:hypothetical protein